MWREWKAVWRTQFRLDLVCFLSVNTKKNISGASYVTGEEKNHVHDISIVQQLNVCMHQREYPDTYICTPINASSICLISLSELRSFPFRSAQSWKCIQTCEGFSLVLIYEFGGSESERSSGETSDLGLCLWLAHLQQKKKHLKPHFDFLQQRPHPTTCKPSATYSTGVRFSSSTNYDLAWLLQCSAVDDRLTKLISVLLLPGLKIRISPHLLKLSPIFLPKLTLPPQSVLD